MDEDDQYRDAAHSVECGHEPQAPYGNVGILHA